MFSKVFSFNGRIRRTEYGISAIVYLICVIIIRSNTDTGYRSDSSNLIVLAYIPLLWFFWSQGAKRCHDVGRSGWWQIIPFYFLWLIFEDGQPYENEYGEDPKGRNDDTSYLIPTADSSPLSDKDQYKL